MKRSYLSETENCITSLFILGLMVFLQGCMSNVNMPMTPLSVSVSLSPTSISVIPTSTRTPYPTTNPIAPTFAPSILQSLLTKAEFDRQNVIFFTSSKGISDYQNIFIVNINGTDKECITCNVISALEGQGYTVPTFEYPAWTLDGTIFAYVFASLEKNSILVSDEDLNVSELIFDPNYWYADLDLSTDGEHITFSTGPNRIGFGSSSVCYMDVVFSNPEFAQKHCISPEKVNEYPSWSPDGKKIIFSAGGGLITPGAKQMDIYIWDLDNQSVSQFTNTPESEIAPRWSPDGTKLAYVVVDSETHIHGLLVANADGSRAVHMDRTDTIGEFDWSPDSRQIVFTQVSPIPNDTCEGGGCQSFMTLKIINPETGVITTLTDGKEWIGHPSWRP